MRIHIDVTMDYQLRGDAPVLLTLEAADIDGQTVIENALEIENATFHRINADGMFGGRVWAFVTDHRLTLTYHAQVDIARSKVELAGLAAMPLHMIPGEILTYLRPSRYCQSDLFTDFVGKQFGHLKGGAKIAAIKDWVSEAIAYTSGSSNATTTAVDTFKAREGVCRDYTHLVCALARAANIPARYASVYGTEVSPQDFHAVAQVWLDDAWHLVDATGMSTADATVLIGAGRDAGDVAFMETEQWADPISQTVSVSKT